MTAGAIRIVVLGLGLVVASSANAHEGTHAELAALDARITEAPSDAHALVTRAYLLRREGRIEEAYVDVENAMVEAPPSSEDGLVTLREILLERALILEQMGAAAAEDDLDCYFELAGDGVTAFAARARLALASGRLDDARAAYDGAIRRAPDPELVLARARLDVARGELVAAARGLEEGLLALKGAMVVRLELVHVATARGDTARAEALIDEVLPTVGAKADLLLERASVREAAGRRGEARADREAALAEVDAGRQTDLRLVTRAKALLALGRRDEAIAELRGVISRSPRLEEPRRLLASAMSLTDGKVSP